MGEQDEAKTVLTKNSRITLGFAATVLSGVLWVHGAQTKTEVKLDQMEQFERRQHEINEKLLERTSEMNGKLDTLLEKAKTRK